MEKKRGLILLILLASISFVSAQTSGIGDFLDAFGGENILLIGIFIISLALITFILGRLPTFKDKITGKPDKKVPVVIALVISLFIIYAIHTTNFDLGGFFTGYGVEQDSLYSISAIAIIIGVVYLLWKYKSKVFLVAGILLIGFSLTGWAYESEKILIAGITLIVLWLILEFLKRKKQEAEYSPTGIDDIGRRIQIEEEKSYRKKFQELEERRKWERHRTAERLLKVRAKAKELTRIRDEAERRRREIAAELGGG